MEYKGLLKYNNNISKYIIDSSGQGPSKEVGIFELVKNIKVYYCF
jgi:hypothetical protein